MDRKVRIQITGMFPNLMSEEKIAVKNGVLQNHRVLRSSAKTRIPENLKSETFSGMQLNAYRYDLLLSFYATPRFLTFFWLIIFSSLLAFY